MTTAVPGNSVFLDVSITSRETRLFWRDEETKVFLGLNHVGKNKKVAAILDSMS